jgi:DNA polymerase (family 10)
MSDAPTVEVLLDIDREYRDKTRAGLLPKIAPRRFNPEHEPWLPVLHTRYGPWRFTALFSSTELARELHRGFDWVVIFFSDAEGEEGQATVVTERRGDLTGQRVVRGREPECARYYRSRRAPPRGEPSRRATAVIAEN